MRVEDLPGELILWILILSELAVFMAGVTVMVVLGLMDPAGFSAAQAQLDGRMAALNTLVLVTSGLFAAQAERAARAGRRAQARRGLLLAVLGGVVFLIVKGVEYGRDIRAGLGIDSHPFFTFYYLLSGFHAAHVVAGVAVLALVAIHARPEPVQAGAMFWHMVDLVWVLILPAVWLIW
ncbi:cytochrome c oxidase subunit 3 [Paracoccus sp. DMF-8]|uniref:cytochrome c oxidase subunit 3 n=1 Tax=Paracoccus sp. DMF-8 TaxID=3019445 RepID=UPI0023E43ED3|nr:cytochrome c oxidase subunit 3 [Paracoccus sp. DMF-8]MDF3608176.1 cytochrome c oxidase subunit 3 [Paracoccus sp. DMF-8]